MYVTAFGKDTIVVCGEKELVSKMAIAEIAKSAEGLLIPMHRSYLVNQRHILSYDAGTMTVTLDDESVVYLSRAGKARLKEALSW